MFERWRYSRFAEVAVGAFASALGIALALVVIAALVIGLAVGGAWIAEGVR